MIVSEKIIDGIAVISVKGKLMGASETYECHDHVKDCISRGYNRIVVDLEKVEWVNSRALGMLMACFTSCRNAEGDMRLCRPSEKTKSILRITKLDTIFEIFDSIDQAVASYK